MVKITYHRTTASTFSSQASLPFWSCRHEQQDTVPVVPRQQENKRSEAIVSKRTLHMYRNMYIYISEYVAHISVSTFSIFYVKMATSEGWEKDCISLTGKNLIKRNYISKTKRLHYSNCTPCGQGVEYAHHIPACPMRRLKGCPDGSASISVGLRRPTV